MEDFWEAKIADFAINIGFLNILELNLITKIQNLIFESQKLQILL